MTKDITLAISGLFHLFGIYLILIEFVSSLLLNLFDFLCMLAISYMYRSLPNIPYLQESSFVCYFLYNPNILHFSFKERISEVGFQKGDFKLEETYTPSKYFFFPL